MEEWTLKLDVAETTVCDERGDEHHEHQLGRVLATRPPEAPDACRTNCPSDGGRLMGEDASIMSISWIVFWPEPPTSPRHFQNKLPTQAWKDEACATL